MNKVNKLLPLIAVFATPTMAEQIPSKYLINNQLHQLVSNDPTPQYKNHLSIGYYEFTHTSTDSGTVKHTRLQMRPEDGFVDTYMSAKHVSVPIRNNVSEQVCKESDMGRMTRPTLTNEESYGTFTYKNNVLAITFNGTTVHWGNSGEDGRWDNNTPKSGVMPSGWVYEQAMGFGYFTDKLGPDSGGLDFRKHFRQGDVFNSASAYSGGKIFSNIIDSVQPKDASIWPEYVGEFKLSGSTYSNRNNDNATQDVFSKIFEETHYEFIPGEPGQYYNFYQFYQSSLLTNYYTAMPTLIYENHGHIKPTKHPEEEDDGTNTANEVEYKSGYGVSEEAHYSRRCWTELDSIQTKGHNSIHMGVWNEQTQDIDKMVSLELAQTNLNGEYFYPVIAMSYGAGRAWHNDQVYMARVLQNLLGDSSMLQNETARVKTNNILGNDWIVELMDDNRFKTRQALSRLYFAMLKRAPDFGGLNYWAGQLESNKTMFDVAQAIGGTPEFNALYGNMSNAEFVNQAYLNILGRPADQGGFDFYKAQLDSNSWTRAQMLLTFAESAENVTKSQYRDPLALISVLILEKTPVDSELNQMAENVKNGTKMTDAIADILYRM